MKSAMKPAKEIKWKIYYEDFSTFDQSQGTPADAPATGVIAIVQDSADNGWVVTAFKDFYWWMSNEWWGGDAAGFWQQMFKGGAIVMKFGISTDNDTFNEVMKRATADQQFAIKTASTSLEPGVQEGWADGRKIS